MSRGARKLYQLKGELETHRQGTFELARVFIECSRYLDHVLDAKWWREPLTVLTRVERVKLLDARLKEVQIELGYRYRGVMIQMLQCIDPQANPDVEIGRTFETVAKAAITMEHYEFSKELWHIFVRGRQSLVHGFKPKFMLRQFVDEILSSKDQGILIGMAYGPALNPRPPDSEILRCLEFAYQLLHVEVSKRSSDLDALTDKEISGAMIAKFITPYAQYEDWLLNCSCLKKSRSRNSHGKR